MTLLCRLLKQLPTREHSAEELDNLLAGKLGFLSFTTEVMTQPEVDGVRPYLLVSAGAVREDRCAGESAARGMVEHAFGRCRRRPRARRAHTDSHWA